ncbi:hypothetical protein OE88DRAFT_1709460 [Heliocybe sulcata]|uniref:Pentacotripeptide-repeat region of PRORP domain-containing protein n=1 Tax=Heliocybe sulcata TaxID=5364 RepID=A0A5C3NH44_9AGAM|nr:hypothetical protein OE88DRAFT_1709460 [Heliocybe sulcata]
MEAEDWQALAEPPLSQANTTGYGRTQLFIAAITAHAMRDSFNDALHMALRFRLRVRQPSVTLFLEELNGDEALKRKVAEYMLTLDRARLVSQPASLSRWIKDITNDHRTGLLEKRYNEIVAGFYPPNPWLAPTPEAVSKERPVLMPTTAWTSFIGGFLKCRRVDLAEKLWNDARAQGVKPGIEMWTALLDGYGAIRALDETLITWDAMKEARIKPDCMAYRALLSTLFNMRKTDLAMARFKEFEMLAFPKSAEQSQVLQVYNTVLHGLLLARLEEQARDLYQRMKTGGPTPDVVSYNTFMQYYARKGDMKSFASSFQALTDAGLEGDVFTWSTVLSALYKTSRKDGPQLVTNIMRMQKITPNVATYTAILDHAVGEKDESKLKGAFDLLRWMEQQQDPGIWPNEVTYTSFLSGMCRNEWLDPKLRDECKSHILQSMERRNIKPNRVTYHILLKACLQNPRPEGLRQALAYYADMDRHKVEKDYNTWWIILSGLIRRGDWGAAQEIVNQMRRKGFIPTGGLLNLIRIVYNGPRQSGDSRRRPV